jgi:hypothetical protein
VSRRRTSKELAYAGELHEELIAHGYKMARRRHSKRGEPFDLILDVAITVRHPRTGRTYAFYGEVACGADGDRVAVRSRESK